MPRIHIHPDLFSDLDDVFRRVDAWLGGHGLDGRHGLAHLGSRLAPHLDVREDSDGWTLTADVPGLGREDLDVSLEGDVLTLSARAPDPVDDGWRPVRSERRHAPTFERKVRFGRPVLGEGVEASLADGVLRVRVPKRLPAPVSIAVHEA